MIKREGQKKFEIFAFNEIMFKKFENPFNKFEIYIDAKPLI